jgi:hypothetical protein
MATFSETEQTFMNAVFKYGVEPSNPEIKIARSNLADFINQELQFNSTDGYTCITTDPMEEFDDLVMLRFGVYNITGLSIVIISGGYFTPDNRFDYLKGLFPCFAGAEFDVPFPTPTGQILFKRDGDTVPYKIKRFINCGPCASTTLNSIVFDTNAKLVTVGANDDGTLGAGINQKQTDEPGKLIVIPDIWNNFIKRTKTFGVTVKNMSVDVTRYVLFPNPTKCHPSNPFYELTQGPILNSMIKSTAMFLISRPPPEYGLRVNEGNSIVDIQLYCNFKHAPLHNYQRGLEKFQEYIKLAQSKGLESKYYESAAIPIMITNCIGGVYKDGMFGFGPTDKHAKETLGCLTQESAKEVIDYITNELNEFTPAYDPLAFIEAFN